MTDGRKRAARKLPPAYHIAQTEVFGQAAYTIRFSEKEPRPDLVIRCARIAGQEYAVPLAVLMPADKKSITVFLDGPDDRLKLLCWLARTFRPARHHGRIRYHTFDKPQPRAVMPPYVVISFVDMENKDDLWAVAATLMGLEGVLLATVNEVIDSADNKIAVCTVEFGDGVDAKAVWELLHDPDVQGLVEFDAHQAPPE